MDQTRRQVVEGRVNLPQLGEVVRGRSSVPPWVVLGEDGNEVDAISAYLRDLALSDRSQLTVRSYAFDLLRWWRLLAVVEVSWERATRSDVELLVGWMRSASNGCGDGRTAGRRGR